MSLITRCPACATQFKVVPDQLKLSAGWVRCGHCSDVFDATRYLESWAPGALTPEVSGDQQAPSDSSLGVPAQSQPPLSQTAALEQNEPRNLTTFRSLDSFISAAPQLDAPAVSVAKAARPTATGVGFATWQQGGHGIDQTADFHAELNRFAKGSANIPLTDQHAVVAARAVLPAAPATVSEPAPDEPIGAQAIIESAFEQPAGSPALASLEPDFMRQARRRAFWRSPSVRALLSGVVILLMALLATQWMLQERDQIAARHPAWKPLLASLCEPLGCSIGAVRDLQAVVIDSSTLTRRIGDFYSFDLVLKNTADIPLAVPALELSLTDTADAVISRRVFLPEELPGVAPLLPAASTVPVSLRLSLSADGGLPMAGYRALVFYP